MSCFMMDPRALAVLADGIEKGLNMGYNYLGLDVSEGLPEALIDCADRYMCYDAGRIYAKLYELNARAYNCRYCGNPADPADPTAPEMPALPWMLGRAVWDGAFRIDALHFKFLKLLECFNYQCLEDATKGDPLAVALRDWEKSWAAFLVHNDPIYKGLRWGEV